MLALTACSSQTKTVEISTKPINKPVLTLPAVDEVSLRRIDWVVINSDNVNEIIDRFKQEGKAFALYSLTGEDYGDLGLNFSDIRALVQQQQAIIVAYENYYKQAEKKLDNAVTIE